MIPLIDVAGGPAARGEAYGRQAKSWIDTAIGFYRADFAARGVEWAEAERIAESFRDGIEAFDPAIATEIEAIARGAKVPVAAIVLLNARTEVLFWHASGADAGPALKPGPEAEECTSAIVMPERSAEGRLWHAQNWDWRPDAAAHTVAVRITGAEVPDALHFVEAGQLARHGLNRCGIAVTAMGLHTVGQYGKPGIPSPVVRRRVLQQESFGRALGEVFRSPASFSHALMISHGEGEAWCLECTPDRIFWLEPEEGVLSHANHFKHPAAVAADIERNLTRVPDSLYRDGRVARRLKAGDKASLEDMKRAFADRFGAPDAVLRHPNQRPGSLLSATVYTLIMSPSEGAAQLSIRPWEGTDFQHFTL
ncbi:C45 family autoproteolytic acyltransferase/hydolase [Aureimonas populi]|uniref:C45 family autoproteolytic acyltransferase/hydrolase n=1 Tax=Aureimonas populi TaxID=1701758 RepID=A0ABW5CNL0_9HYPH|nr:C45 family peptidase [Aureimonas populi]